jgi:uncharacterized membrane protein YcaP (DUF421 family)
MESQEHEGATWVAIVRGGAFMDAFELKRMFIGDGDAWLLLEVAFRTVFLYAYAVLVVRLLGKRGMSNLSPFEYVVVFAAGTATGEPMLYPEVPLVYGMIVLTTIVLAHRVIARLTRDSEQLERLLEGKPRIIVQDGAPIEDALEAEQLSLDELLMELRMKGVENVGQVRYAFLEPSGDLSVFQYEGESRNGISTLVFEA